MSRPNDESGCTVAERLLLTHVWGAPESGGGGPRCICASPALDPADGDTLDSQVYYAPPEDRLTPPPTSWALQRVAPSRVALSRTVPLPRAGGLLAPFSRSLVFGADVVTHEPARLLDLAALGEAFPTPEPGACAAAPPVAWPAAGARVTEILSAIVQFTRGERPALLALLHALLRALEQGSALRYVVFALPPEFFVRDGDLLRLFVACLLLTPRALRPSLAFATYQDAPTPRPLPLLGIPAGHRCIPRLVRSPGYFVYPDQAAAPSEAAGPVLHAYASAIADYLLAGRFEEAAAYADTSQVQGPAAGQDSRAEAERLAELRRLAGEPQPDDLLAWMDRYALPASSEDRSLAVSALVGAISLQVEHRHYAGVQRLLRTAAARWPELHWDDAELGPLETPLVRLVDAWQTEHSWDAVCGFFGRLTGSGWARALVTRALADVLAQRDEAPQSGRIDQALAQVELQLDAQGDVRPPQSFLRWLARHAGLDDPRLARYLERALGAREPGRWLQRLFLALGTPADPGYRRLLRGVLVPLSRANPEAASQLLGELFARFDLRAPESRALLFESLDELARAGHGDLLLALLDRALLAAGPAASGSLSLDELAPLALAVDRQSWERYETSVLSAEPIDARRGFVLRAAWLVRYRRGLDGACALLLARLERLHRACPELVSADLQPHATLLDLAGPVASVTLLLAEQRILEDTQDDRTVERHLASCLAFAAGLPAVDAWQWEAALLKQLVALPVAADRARGLWRLWSVAGSVGLHALQRAAFRQMLYAGLLADLDEAALEALCRLLPSGMSLSRPRIVAAAVEGALFRWSQGAASPDDVYRIIRAQADALQAADYAELVTRAFLALFGASEALADPALRAFLDGVYAPRHATALEGALQALLAQRWGLADALARVRRAGGFQRFSAALLAFVEARAPAPSRSGREL